MAGIADGLGGLPGKAAGLAGKAGGLAGTLGGLAGKGVSVAAQGTAMAASATTGFIGGMISPLVKFFNDFTKQRVAAADEATKKREARDHKIVEICDVYWNQIDIQ